MIDKPDKSDPPWLKPQFIHMPGEIFIDTEVFLVEMKNIKEACQVIMDSGGETTTEAKTHALSLQIAAMGMSILIMENNFWKEGANE